MYSSLPPSSILDNGDQSIEDDDDSAMIRALTLSAKASLREAANENVLLRMELRRTRRRLLHLVQDNYFLAERMLRHEKPKKGRPPVQPTEEKLREKQRPKRKYKKRMTKAEKEAAAAAASSEAAAGASASQDEIPSDLGDAARPEDEELKIDGD